MSDTPETDAFMTHLWEQYDQGRLSLENLESRMVSKIRDLERDRNTFVAKTLVLASDLGHAQKALNKTRRCLGFLKSIAQGGEAWTEQAQLEYDKACANIDAAITKAKGGGHE